MEGEGQELAAGQALVGAQGLVPRLPLAGRVVPADSRFTQREVCELVEQRGGPA